MSQSFKAYAKLNLNLYVGPPEIGGLHSICSVFQLISLYDELIIESADMDSIIFENQDVPKDNTCSKVLSLLRGQLKQCWQVRVMKHIPSGAGLGGGSSNAATLLMALNQLEALNLTVSDMAAIASKVGSDVPYFLHGGQAKVSGTGDIIEPRGSYIDVQYFVLILPNIHCSTVGVYQALDDFGEFDDLSCVTHDELKVMGHNRLLAPAKHVSHDLSVLYDEVSQLLDEDVFMSGSGSTLFVPCHDVDAQQRIYSQLLGELPGFNGKLVSSNALNFL